MALLRSPLYEVHAQAGATFLPQDGWELAQVFSSSAEEFHAAEASVVVHDLSHTGRLKAVGADCLDLLNRLSTNKVDELGPGQGAPTILTNDRGRIVDLVHVVNLGDHVLLLTSPDTQEPVITWLDKYTIMDDVEVEDHTQASAMLALIGPTAPAALAGVSGLTLEDLAAVPAYGSTTAVIAGSTTRIVHQPVGGLPGYALVTTAEDASGVWGALLAAGVAPMGTEAYDALRVARAVPTYGREMGEQYNPLEAGLIGSIDFTKGCYIGQEVIARLDSYDKVQKHLVTLKFEHAAHVCQGAEMVQEGRVVGVVTSLSTLPDGDLVGMGYVRKAFASTGSRLDLQAPSEGSAEVSGVSQLFGPGA